MLVNLRLHLEVGEVVYLSDVLSGSDVLSQLNVEQSEFAVDSRAHLELVLAVAHQEHVLAHVVEVVLHLRHLHVAVETVLLQALRDKTLLAACELIVLTTLQIHLLADEALLVEACVLFVGAALAVAVGVERSLLGTVVESVLLHRHLRVAQQVLLLGEFGLSIQNLQVEIAVAESEYHVALSDACTLLHNLLAHYAALLGRDLHHLDRQHLSVETHIVVELAASDVADGDVCGVYGHRTGGCAEHYPHEERSECGSRSDIPCVAAEE